MRIIIACIGKAKNHPEHKLAGDYAARLPWKLEWRELEEKKPLPAPALKKREAELLLEATQDAKTIIALDERGKDMTSRDFSQLIAQARDDARWPLAFVIGGADGLDESLLSKAHYRLRLGQMTWPHMLVRVMLAEQIYRAHSLLTNHPYHRD